MRVLVRTVPVTLTTLRFLTLSQFFGMNHIATVPGLDLVFSTAVPVRCIERGRGLHDAVAHCSPSTAAGDLVRGSGRRRAPSSRTTAHFRSHGQLGGRRSARHRITWHGRVASVDPGHGTQDAGGERLSSSRARFPRRRADAGTHSNHLSIAADSLNTSSSRRDHRLRASSRPPHEHHRPLKKRAPPGRRTRATLTPQVSAPPTLRFPSGYRPGQISRPGRGYSRPAHRAPSIKTCVAAPEPTSGYTRRPARRSVPSSSSTTPRPMRRRTRPLVTTRPAAPRQPHDSAA